MRNGLLAGAANVAHLAGLAVRPSARRQAARAAAAAAVALAEPPAPGATEQQPAPAATETPPASPPATPPAASTSEGTKARDTEDDEDEDEDEEDDDEYMEARARERRRVQAILTSPHAARAVQLAAHLAFDTSMPRQQAIAILERTPAGGGLNAAMAGVQQPNLGNGGRADKPDGEAIAKGWDKAFHTVASTGRAAGGWDRAMQGARR